MTPATLPSSHPPRRVLESLQPFVTSFAQLGDNGNAFQVKGARFHHINGIQVIHAEAKGLCLYLARQCRIVPVGPHVPGVELSHVNPRLLLTFRHIPPGHGGFPKIQSKLSKVQHIFGLYGVEFLVTIRQLRGMGFIGVAFARSSSHFA